LTIAVLALTAFSLSKETKIVIPLLVRRKITFWGRIKIEVIFEKYLESKILKALFNSHLYEVGYEIYEMQNNNKI
jgi:hypothetical protein